MLTAKGFDNAIRWREGERLDHLFERRCDALQAAGVAGHPAVVAGDAAYTFGDLDRRANQVARYLAAQGVGASDRVGLLFDKSFETYVALLAVLKINAAYVPLDAAFPDERIAFILSDAGVGTIVSQSQFVEELSAFPQRSLFLDSEKNEIDAFPVTRLSPSEKQGPNGQLCYIIYTSGTTGNPKGVAIDHPSICNFVRVAGEVYGYRQDDRVYQGMTIAFDFSVEELWVPLIAGATLVPGKPGTSLVGNDLADFLVENRVTAICCVPTLLATIERDLPALRFLLVSGEACPQSLVARWHRPGRAMLNAYGPTEATVTATLTELHPDRAVTIGGPLPTYTIVILDESEGAEVVTGALGEIGIAGIGLAEGYLNRPDLTAKKFIADFLDLPNNPSKRIYRTGDLGRINEAGEVEFHGRIDTQIKLRGYRIELGEIEAALESLPEIGQAVVHTWEPEPGAVELVAYYTVKQGAQVPQPSAISETLRRSLPAYMVPAYLERLPAIPMTTSNKADRKALPPPKGPRAVAGTGSYVAPANDREKVLAETLADILKVEHVSVTDNFFTQLGAHSLLMARFCAEIRKRANLAASMRDVYLNPTISKLAAHLGSGTGEGVSGIAVKRQPLHIASTFDYVRCGFLQLVAYLTSVMLIVEGLELGFEWALAPGHSFSEMYFRIVAFSFAAFVTLCAVPIALKWTLIGRWKPEVIPVWSLRYFVFWLVRFAARSAPVAFLRGTPLYNLYLRLLGAKVGPNSVLWTRFLPVATDLVAIGDNTILRKDAILLGYKAEAGRIYLGSVSIGDGAIVGEASVLDIDTEIGDGGQLGHVSSLQSGQRIPAGKHYHGSPAEETSADYRFVEPMLCTPLRRRAYAAFQLAFVFLALTPATVLFIYYFFKLLMQSSVGAALLEAAPAQALAVLAAEMALAAGLLIAGLLLVGLLAVYAIPRALNALLVPDKTYVLYGFHYVVMRAVSRLSNVPAFNFLFGDSAFIVGFLNWIGLRLNRIEQTGSNFGLDQRHDNPFLCDIGSGTMASDGLSMINAPMTSSSFSLRETRIGDKNYLGNNIIFPAAARTGANCLLATNVMVPVDGPIRENVGLLGSPPFEIPRVVDRDQSIKRGPGDPGFPELLAGKTRTNAATIAMLLLSNWLYSSVAILAFYLAFANYAAYGMTAIYASLAFVSAFSIAYFAFIERASLAFGSLRPSVVSMYDGYFLFHERHWKFCGSPLVVLFNGTPFKNLVARLLGVKLGEKVFNDGSLFFDKTLLEIGDYATLNEFAMFKGHSLEEGVFKSDRVVVGNGCTVGVGALIHYGVRIADDVVIDPDSFLMKGETPETGTVWRGNPARAISSAPATAAASDASMDVVLAAGSAHRERRLQPVDLSSAG